MHGSSRFLVVLAVLAAPVSTFAQSPAEIAAATTRRNGRAPPVAAAVHTDTPPTIDGKLDDAAWTQAPVINTFTQRDPEEGAPASESTEVRIAYDNGDLHRRPVPRPQPGHHAAWPSGHGDLVVGLVRREPRQLLRLAHGVPFEVNPSGVRRDSIISGRAATPATWPGMRCGTPRRASTPTAGPPRFAFPSASSGSARPTSSLGPAARAHH